MEKETFSMRLKQAMQQQGIKQVDLIRAAEKKGLKLGKSHISQYVSGKTVPRAELLHFLAETLKVDETWLKAEEQPGIIEEEKEMDRKKGGSGMREFKKSSKLDHVLYDVRGPVVDEAAHMEQSGIQVLKLNIGNPAPFGFRAPDEVIYDMSHQLTDCEGYSASKGLFSARKAIMQS